MDTCPVVSETFTELLRHDDHAIAAKAALFSELRDQGPIVWIPALDAYAVTRYDVAVQVLTDHDLFSSQLGDSKGRGRERYIQARDQLVATSPEFAVIARRLDPDFKAVRMLGETDAPQHVRDRRLVNRLFTPRRVAGMVPRITDIAHDLIDAMATAVSVDLASDYAAPIPRRVIAEQLGIGSGDYAMFQRWVSDLLFTLGNDSLTEPDVIRITETMVAFDEFFRSEFETVRNTPRDDFVSTLANMEDLRDDERLSIMAQLLNAGTETSAKAIASCLVALYLHPDLAVQIQADPAMIPPFVEEILRLEAPIQGLYRYARRDSILADVLVPAGAAVWVLFGSANRSADVYERPDQLHLGRQAASHLAFGRGVHFCVGAPLARAEAIAAVGVALERLWPWTVDSVEMERSYIIHGPRRVLARLATGRSRTARAATA